MDGPDLRHLLCQKSSSLFSLCDQEEKGFVTKRDMQRLRGELPLDPDQLEAVFDTLDSDGNGYLTLEEFTQGFSSFLGMEGNPGEQEEEIEEEEEPGQLETVVEHQAELDVAEEEEEFRAMLGELGALGLIQEDDATLRDMWSNLRREGDPALMENFESFLNKLAGELRKKTTEQERFENSIKRGSQVQEERLQELYEEMEQQIGAERERLRKEEERKEMQLREELESTVSLKDQQLMEVMARMSELQVSLDAARAAVPTIKDENTHLAKERDRLQNEVERQRLLMGELSGQMDELRTVTQSERRERAKMAFKVSENIAQEREGLVQELSLVKALNNKMLDEQDCAVAQESTLKKNGVNHPLGELFLPPIDITRSTEVTNLDSFDSSTIHRNNSSLRLPKNVLPNEDVECDEEFFEQSSPALMRAVSASAATPPSARKKRGGKYNSQVPETLSLADELAGSLPSLEPPLPFPTNIADDYNSSRQSSIDGHRAAIPASLRNNPLACYSTTVSACDSSNLDSLNNSDFGGVRDGRGGGTESYVMPLSRSSTVTSVRDPERVFKVIFIGDSSVGKSSLIRRFCTGAFQPGLKSTIGVDFHTRSLLVEEDNDNTSVCLQCWDTAGQERYRSITRQYFRKADAVVIVYDITSENSFLNAREWLDSAVEAAGDSASLLLLGNKLDLAEDDLLRSVRKTEGVRLATEYSSQFGETSAVDGRNVDDVLMEMAKLLRKREDDDMQKALTLSLETKDEGRGAKKKKCCGK